MATGVAQFTSFAHFPTHCCASTPSSMRCALRFHFTARRRRVLRALLHCGLGVCMYDEDFLFCREVVLLFPSWIFQLFDNTGLPATRSASVKAISQATVWLIQRAHHCLRGPIHPIERMRLLLLCILLGAFRLRQHHRSKHTSSEAMADVTSRRTQHLASDALFSSCRLMCIRATTGLLQLWATRRTHSPAVKWQAAVGIATRASSAMVRVPTYTSQNTPPCSSWRAGRI